MITSKRKSENKGRWTQSNITYESVAAATEPKQRVIESIVL